MTVVTTISLTLLVLAGILCLVRLVRGPSLAERIVALDLTLVIVVAGIAVQSVRTGSTAYLDVLVVAALLGFVSSVTVARYIESRGA